MFKTLHDVTVLKCNWMKGTKEAIFIKNVIYVSPAIAELMKTEDLNELFKHIPVIDLSHHMKDFDPSIYSPQPLEMSLPCKWKEE